MNYYNEWDKKAAAWLAELISEKLIPDGKIDTRSITDVRATDLAGFTQCHFFAGIGGWPLALALAGWPEDEPVWSLSCPCPPFSSAGKKKCCPACGRTRPIPCPVRTGYFICLACEHAWFADGRHLFPECYRLIRDADAPVCFGEQVAGPDGLIWLAGVRACMEALGRPFGAADLAAASVGAPHLRQRLWWVADARQQPSREFAAGEGAGAGELLLGRSAKAGGESGGCGSDFRLAHAGRPRDERRGGPGEASGAAEGPEAEARERERRGPDARSLCEHGRMEDTQSQRRDERPVFREEGDQAWHPESRDGSGTRRLADADGRKPRDGELQCGGEHGQQPQDDRTISPLAHAELARLEGHAGDVDDGDESGRLDAGAAGSTPTRSRLGTPWDDYDIIPCGDGKARRIESRVHSLADGLPEDVDAGWMQSDGTVFPLAKEVKNRVPLLKGGGNAIVSMVAAQFIIAYREARR